MAANGISTLANKKLRQEAKLAQAEADRAARNVVEPGRYAYTTADLTPEMKRFPFTDGGIEMFLEVRRLDGGATQDLFYHLTMGID